MPESQPARQPHCPACNAILSKGMANCPVCGMEVAKMKEYIMAMQHARKRAAEQKASGAVAAAPAASGRKIKPVSHIEAEPGESHARRNFNHELFRAAKWLIVLVVLISGGVWAYQKLTAPSEPWRRYPTDPRTLLTQFIKIVHTDDRKEHNKAYDLISLHRKNLKDDDQRGQYMQLFHDVHQYFSTLFGDNYVNEIRFEPEGNNPEATTWTGTIRTEKMTIDIEQQEPSEKQRPGQPKHWGIVAIREFPLGNSSRSQQMGAIGGILKGLGAGGSARQIQGIAGYGADLSRMSPAEIKQMLLPLISNPRSTGLTQNIYRTWVVRKDPTVRETLQQIMQDTRYGDTDRSAAQQVLNDRVPEEILIGVGISNTE